MNMALSSVHRPLRCQLPGVSPCRLPAADEWQAASQGWPISALGVALGTQAESQHAPNQEWSEPLGCSGTDLHACGRLQCPQSPPARVRANGCPGLPVRPEPGGGQGQVHQLGVAWPRKCRFLGPVGSPGHGRSAPPAPGCPWALPPFSASFSAISAPFGLGGAGNEAHTAHPRAQQRRGGGSSLTCRCVRAGCGAALVRCCPRSRGVQRAGSP